MNLLRKMDVRLDRAFNQMIVQKMKGTPTLFCGDKLTIGESWVGVICNLASEFDALADPDALSATPILAAICESKSAEVQSMDISDDLKDDMLYEISLRRKQLGIDARERAINKGRSSNTDVW